MKQPSFKNEVETVVNMKYKDILFSRVKPKM